MSQKTKELLRIRMERLGKLTEFYELAAKKGGGSLPTFIEGLIASSALIEEIQQDLSPIYSVRWGQVIAGDQLSKEIDIVIFEGKPIHEWRNISYAIIPKEQVKAVVEVNIYFGSGVSSIKEYEDICKSLKPFSPKVYLFCFECYFKQDKTLQEHRQTLIRYGFNDIFILKRKTNGKISYIEDDWFRFVETIKKL